MAMHEPVQRLILPGTLQDDIRRIEADPENFAIAASMAARDSETAALKGNGESIYDASQTAARWDAEAHGANPATAAGMLAEYQRSLFVGTNPGTRTRIVR